MRKPSTTVKAILALIFSNLIWGFLLLFTKTGLDHCDPLVFLAERFVISFAMMNIYMLVTKTKLYLKGKPLWPLMLLGLFEFVLSYFISQIGIMQSSTSFAGITNAIMPVLGLIGSTLFLKERPTRGQVIFCIISIFCVALISLQSESSGTTTPVGILCLFLALFSSEAYALMSRRYSVRYTPFTQTYVMLGFATVVFVSISLIWHAGDLSVFVTPFQEPIYVISLIYSSGISSVLAYLLFSYALAHLPIYRTASFACVRTAVSVLAGVLILGEPFSIVSFIASAIAIFCVWGIQKTSAKDGPTEYVEIKDRT